MKRKNAFTLIELLVVVAIIGMLASMMVPHIAKFQDRAQSVVCMNNLRQIGVGVLSYVGEHDNTYPIIEMNAEDPVYLPEDEATPIYVALEPYGVTQQVLKCPADIKGPNYFAKNTTTIDGKSYGTSYQWRPIIDEENSISPKIYGGRRGAGVRIVKPSRVTICTDYAGVHSGRLNRLYADGHVSRPY
ncbi:MAG: prepilin-type N-terminal cleavage/methylation domain-containing protein [Terrimicrobiaceae bacterium]